MTMLNSKNIIFVKRYDYDGLPYKFFVRLKNDYREYITTSFNDLPKTVQKFIMTHTEEKHDSTGSLYNVWIYRA